MLKRPDRASIPDRHARHRARVRAGLACTTIEFSAEVVDWLVRLGWLTESEVLDRTSVGKAISKLIEDSARS
jgi:hypothetical protein